MSVILKEGEEAVKGGLCLSVIISAHHTQKMKERCETVEEDTNGGFHLAGFCSVRGCIIAVCDKRCRPWCQMTRMVSWEMVPWWYADALWLGTPLCLRILSPSLHYSSSTALLKVYSLPVLWRNPNRYNHRRQTYRRLITLDYPNKVLPTCLGWRLSSAPVVQRMQTLYFSELRTERLRRLRRSS